MPMPDIVIGVLTLINIMTGEMQSMPQVFANMEECQAASAAVAEQVRLNTPDEVLMNVRCLSITEFSHPEASV